MSTTAAICDGCAKAAENPQRCSRCKKAVYCDATCQRTHWKTHKAVCVPPNAQQPEHEAAVTASEGSAAMEHRSVDTLHQATELITADRENPVGYVRRAELHCAMKQMKEAAVDATKAVELDHRDAAVAHRLIKVLVALEKYDEARKLTERALELTCDKRLRVELQAIRAELENWALPLSSMNLREVEERFPVQLRRLYQLQKGEMEQFPKVPELLGTATTAFLCVSYDILRHYFAAGVNIDRLCAAFASKILSVKYSPQALAARKDLLTGPVEKLRSDPPPQLTLSWNFFLRAFEIEDKYAPHFAKDYIPFSAFLANTFSVSLIEPPSPKMDFAVADSLKGLDDMADHICDRQIRKQFIAEWKEMLVGVKGAEHWRV